MTDPTGRYTLVYNGEVYNYQTLRSGLEKGGVEFISSSDTEVVLHHLITHGSKGLSDFNGFFALALYDKHTDQMLIARDRFGIKPLYWSTQRGTLSFASEMKALLPMLPAQRIDKTASYFYFLLNYIPGDLSIYEDVHKLAPGHFLSWENGNTSIERFSPVLPPISINKAESDYDGNVTQLKELLDSSVSDRLVADVPIACFLSGGVDSSIIAAIAAQKKPNLKTFSIGFKDNSYFDESRFSQEVAAHIGTDHSVFNLSSEDMLESVMASLSILDEPFADSSAIAVHALSKMCSKEVTVALSGDGADELFGGYNKHRAHLRAAQSKTVDALMGLASPVLGQLPASRHSAFGNKSRQIQRYLKGAKMPPLDRYWYWASWTDSEYVEKLLSNLPEQVRIDSLKRRFHNGEEGLDSVLRADLTMLLPGDMLVKVDRMSMANSLEVRVPFLDHRLVDFAMRLPISHRIGHGNSKRILKDAYRPMLPTSVFDRPKKGFEVPLESWFNGPLRQQIEEALDPDRAAETGILSPDFVSGLRTRFRKGKCAKEVHLIWALVVWHQTVGKA